MKSSVDRDFAIFALARSFNALIRLAIMMLDFIESTFVNASVISFFEKNDSSFNISRAFNSLIVIVSN